MLFFFGSILLLLLNVEFFAFIFLIVYIGAIAVLFLFMVMTLDIKISNISQKINNLFSYRSFLVLLLLINILLFLQEDYLFLHLNFNENIYTSEFLNYSTILKWETHLEIIGKALFKEYILSFIFCGFILFIAMVGSIVVTIEDSNLKNFKQQDAVIQGLHLQNNIFNLKKYEYNNNHDDF